MTTTLDTAATELTRNIGAVVTDLIRRNGCTADRFAELIGSPRSTVLRQLGGVMPFTVPDLAAMHQLGWASPVLIVAAAERGELYPQPHGEGSIPLAVWAPPAWATIRRMDAGQIYAERWADRSNGGAVITHVVLYQNDEIVERGGEYRVIRHAPSIDFNEVDLTIDTARSMVASGDPDDPNIDALRELVAAYDVAAT